MWWVIAENGVFMSLPPLPPTGGNFQFSQATSVKTYPRRPQVWVPPVIIFGAFAAGYAIPWELGQDPARVFFRVVLPLIIAAVLCGIAGFYSYRTVPGWKTWTWIALGSMVFNGFQFLLIPAMQMPLAVNVMVWISALGLLSCASFGSEKSSPLYQAPSTPNPGFKL
jgi:hypothetical protein